MRELVIRDITTEMGIRGALPEAFEPGVIGMEILQDRNQNTPSVYSPLKEEGNNHHGPFSGVVLPAR